MRTVGYGKFEMEVYGVLRRQLADRGIEWWGLGVGKVDRNLALALDRNFVSEQEREWIGPWVAELRAKGLLPP